MMKLINDEMQIGKVSIEGRIIMPPVGTYKSDADGYVTDALVDYYRQRARNPHVGLIITEHSYIDISCKAKANQLGIDEDAKIKGLAKLVNAIHAEGTKAFAQLNAAGSSTTKEVAGYEPMAPSAVVLPVTPAVSNISPREMTREDIQRVITWFANASVRAKKAGYDGVEVHVAHAYLLNQFYSPLTNHRTDEYGGSIENRLRLAVEVIRAVRQAVGSEYPISVRLGGYDDIVGGNTLEDAAAAASILCAEDIQLLSLTGGMCRYIRKGHNEPGYFGDMAKAVKPTINVPVLLTGGVRTLADAQAVLTEYDVDFVGVGRLLLANPNFGM